MDDIRSTQSATYHGVHSGIPTGSPWLSGAPAMPLPSIVTTTDSDENTSRQASDLYSMTKRSMICAPPHGTCGKTEKYAHTSLASFNDMTQDIRRTFMNWFNTLEMDLCSQWDELRMERETFQDQKKAEMARLAEEREREMDRLAEQRQKNQAEHKAAVKQITIERDETRRKLDDEKKTLYTEINHIKDEISREREVHVQEVRLFESEKSKVVESGLAAQTMVEINVGGTVFESSKHTVSSQKGSFLENLFCGKHKVVRDKNQRIFLDRDPELFRSVLNFLRNPTTPPYPTDEGHSKALVDEATFYGVKFFPYPLTYCLGGHDGTQYLRSVELLDIATQTWKYVKSMNTDRAYAGSGCLGGRLYAFGGQNRDYKVMYDNEVFDVLRGDWFTAPPMETPRRNFGSITANNCLFAIGGYDGTTLLDNVEMLDERLRHWNYIAPLPSARSACSATVFDNLSTGYPDIYVLGGTSGRRLRSVIRYDMRANKWETLDKDMIDVRSAGNSLVHQGQLYSMGGINELHQMNDSMEALDLMGGQMKRDWNYLPGLQTPRLDFNSVGTTESFMVVGGQIEGQVLDTVEFYRPELTTWQSGPGLNTKRYAQLLEVCTI